MRRANTNDRRLSRQTLHRVERPELPDSTVIDWMAVYWQWSGDSLMSPMLRNAIDTYGFTRSGDDPMTRTVAPL